jgi:hypothetical protein
MVHNKDLLLVNSLEKIGLEFHDVLNIYFMYKKVKKGSYIDIDEKKYKKLEKILEKYNIKYKKYNDWFKKNNHLYFMSKNVDPKNIDFFGKNKKLDHIKIGTFLGYGCVHNLDKDKPCTKGFIFRLFYKNAKIEIPIYSFCCLNLSINIINKTLMNIEKMNYFIKKYLSSMLKHGIVLLNIIKITKKSL